MNSQSLQTAADYINNLLLSRGLLRNGEPVAFAHPSRGEGGKETTMARIMNLVHDLILRRDRETDTLTSLSQNMTLLRTASAQQAQTISNLESRAADLERQLAQAISQEKTAKAAVKSADSRNRAMKEEVVRLKSTVSQIRVQCANDVRKRDAEIKRLQKHLETKRGREGSVQVGVTVVTPGAPVGKSGSTSSMTSNGRYSDNGYCSLRDETTDYLTRLSQELGDENDALLRLVQTTLSTLRNLQGLPEISTSHQVDDSIVSSDPNVSASSTTSYEQLSEDLSDAMQHLHSLLTNPSFVSLEEVQMREDEILRLRSGWDKMEARWHEALTLMNGWRQRMVESGDTINLEDLRKGLTLGSDPIGIPPPSVRRGAQGADVSFALPEAKPDESQLHEDETVITEGKEAELLQQRLEQNAKPISPLRKKPEDRLGMGLFPAPNILHPTNANIQRRHSQGQPAAIVANSPGAGVMIDAMTSDDPDELALGDYGQSPSKRRRVSQENDQHETVTKPPRSQSKREIQSPTPDPFLDQVLAATGSTITDPESESESEAEPEPVLTIDEKLAQARREADEAVASLAATMQADHTKISREADFNATPSPIRRHNSTKRAREGSPAKSSQKDTERNTNRQHAAVTENAVYERHSHGAREEIVAVKSGAGTEAQKPVKRTKVPNRVGTGGMRRSKRRSTLSPEELEGLMGL